MNTVIWINDRKSDMECIVRGSFPTLWESGIVSKVVLLGDAVYKDMHNFDSKIFSSLISDVLAMYSKHCSSLNSIYNQQKLSDMNKFYENENPKDVFVLEPSNNKIKKIMDNWKKKNFKQEIQQAKTDEEKSKFIGSSIGDLFSEKEDQTDIIPANSEYLYMLDIVLLEKDYEKLVSEQPSYVLSMALHYYITRILQARCFLYSQHTYHSVLQNNWVTQYRKLDDTTSPDLNIIPRTQFYAGSLNIDRLKLIIKQFNEERK